MGPRVRTGATSPYIRLPGSGIGGIGIVVVSEEGQSVCMAACIIVVVVVERDCSYEMKEVMVDGCSGIAQVVELSNEAIER